MRMICPEALTPPEKIAFYDVPENTAHYIYGARGGWVKEARNPVLTEKHGVLFDVSVMQEDGMFKMWLSWRTNVCIAYCESRDGLNWSDPMIVLEPVKGSDWEGDELNRPSVIKKDGLYYMWYSGQMMPYKEAGVSSIGYAVSDDGIHWRRPFDRPVMTCDQPWEEHAIMCPHVVYEEESGLFKMWYSGGSNHEPDAIGYATSPDGVHWEKYAGNPILWKAPQNPWEQHKVVACHVLRHAGWYYMFYIGHMHEERAQVGMARSRDGIGNWEKHPDNPLICPDKGAWDDLSVYKPYVLRVNGRWMMWYNGARYDEKLWAVEQIGVAYCNEEDFGFEN